MIFSFREALTWEVYKVVVLVKKLSDWNFLLTFERAVQGRAEAWGTSKPVSEYTVIQSDMLATLRLCERTGIYFLSSSGTALAPFRCNLQPTMTVVNFIVRYQIRGSSGICKQHFFCSVAWVVVVGYGGKKNCVPLALISKIRPLRHNLGLYISWPRGKVVFWALMSNLSV